MTTAFMKNNFNDASIVDVRLVVDYLEEHVLTKKDVQFIKKYGVLTHVPTTELSLEDRFFDAVIDAIFYKFRGKSICMDLEILSGVLRLPVQKIAKMLEVRVEKGSLVTYKRKKPTRIFYTNPYEKEYW